MLKRSAMVCLLCCLAGAAPAQEASSPMHWALRLPQQEIVVFKGVVNFDAAGTSGGAMLYPAPNLIGMLAAVATHGVLINSARNGKKSEIEIAADKVLDAYRDIIDSYRSRELMQQAVALARAGQERRLVGSADLVDAGWLVESQAVFSMTQDQSALVLDNTVAIYRPGAAQPSYQNTVLVVSSASEHSDLPAYWHGDQGRRLKDESAGLLAQSLDIALADATLAPPAKPASFHTVHYQQGRQEAMERAQVLSEHCGRSLIRNLRGWLMSIPTPNHGQAAAAPCEAPPAG